MDFYKVPISFVMVLAMNQPAMNAHAAITEDQKQTIVNKAQAEEGKDETKHVQSSQVYYDGHMEGF